MLVAPLIWRCFLQDAYDMMVISPHLDDAALSCGGNIYMMAAKGQRVLVATLMAGDGQGAQLSGYAQDLHRRWQLDQNAAACRRREDEKAARILGADTVHLPFPDCIYRCDPETGVHFYRSDTAIFADVNALDRNLVQEISSAIAELPQSKQQLVPFGVGNHVDHQIARSASEQVFGKDLLYYEEYPYAAEPEARNAPLQKDWADWEEMIIPLTEKAQRVKIEAIAAYQSQLSTFFTDRLDLEQQVSEYVQMIGGERLWRRKYPNA